MATFTWGQSGGGNWNVAADWILSGSPASSVPASADTADLTNAFAGAAYAVTISDSRSAALVSIGAANATLAVGSTGVLTTGAIGLLSGTLDLAGTITGNTTITDGAGAVLRTDGGTLDGVTWKGTLGLTGVAQASLLSITTSLTVLNAAGNGPGEIDITGLGAELNVESSMTLNGTGGNLLINIGGLGGAGNNEYLSVGSNDILTFGTAVTLSQTSAGSNVRLNDVSTLGTIVNNGTLSFTAGAGSSALINVQDFTNNGTIIAQGGILNGESLDITTFNTFTLGTTGQISISDFGRVGITGTVAAGGFDISGQIAVTGQSTLDLNTDAVGSGSIQVSNHSTADIFNFLGTVVFLDATNVLALEQPANFTGAVSGMSRINAGTHDNIDLLFTSPVTNLTPIFTSPTGGVLNVMNNTTTLAAINLIGNYVGAGFGFASDLNGGTDIFLACFASGVRIATSRGGVPVEDLHIGDMVTLATGGTAPVKWLGHRRTLCARHPRPWDVMPVRIRAHAFGPGRPHSDLLLSPDHAVFADGHLIPVRYLLNGATVVQETVDEITYWHVELPAHGLLLAEGLPTESYLDTGNRSAFANGGSAMMLAPDFARSVWDEAGCAPLVIEGAVVEAVRSFLAEQAENLGWQETAVPGLALEVDGRPCALQPAGDAWVALLPPGARHAILGSRTGVPAEHDRDADSRPLGVAVAMLALDGQGVALDDARLGGGWFAPEGAWRWTDGRAGIALHGAKRLALRLGPTNRYWLAPQRRGREQNAA